MQKGEEIGWMPSGEEEGGGGGVVWCGDGWMLQDDPGGWASGLFTTSSITPRPSPFDHRGWAEGLFMARSTAPGPVVQPFDNYPVLHSSPHTGAAPQTKVSSTSLGAAAGL